MSVSITSNGPSIELTGTGANITVTVTTGGGDSGGVTDHGALTGLSDDDHSQYHNDTRGDARYPLKSNNLSDLASAATARTSLGLGTAAEADIGTGSGDVAAGDAPATATNNVVAATGATETLAFATDPDSTVHDVTMDEDCTFSFSGAPSSGTTGSMTVIIRGAFTPTLPASVDWAGGSAPTYASPSVYEFVTVDGGTTVLGFAAGLGLA